MAYTIENKDIVINGWEQAISYTLGSEGDWTISDSTGTNETEYCIIKNSTASGGATWDATDNCTDSGGNSGWDFTGAVVNTTNFFNFIN